MRLNFFHLVVSRILFVFVSANEGTRTGRIYAVAHLFRTAGVLVGRGGRTDWPIGEGSFSYVSTDIFFSKKNYIVFFRKNIADLPNEGFIVNCIGCLMVVFAALVGYLATNVDYKRTPLPEDAILLTGNDD